MKLKALQTWTSLGFGEIVKAGDVFEAQDVRARQLVEQGRAEEVKPPKPKRKSKSE